jgi:hypothetical protein
MNAARAALRSERTHIASSSNSSMPSEQKSLAVVAALERTKERPNHRP